MTTVREEWHKLNPNLAAKKKNSKKKHNWHDKWENSQALTGTRTSRSGDVELK